MEVKEYADKFSEFRITETNIEHGITRLKRAVELLAEWKESTAPLTRDGAARTLHTAAWPTLDEINSLLQRYWQERQGIVGAWAALTEEARNALIALGVQPPDAG